MDPIEISFMRFQPFLNLIPCLTICGRKPFPYYWTQNFGFCSRYEKISESIQSVELWFIRFQPLFISNLISKLLKEYAWDFVQVWIWFVSRMKRNLFLDWIDENSEQGLKKWGLYFRILGYRSKSDHIVS